MLANHTVFVEANFWLLIVFSFVIPAGIFWILLAKRAISRNTVLALGLTMVATAGVDVYLLQTLAAMAKLTPSLADDALFLSEVTMALYLLPAMFGGIGVNLLSQVLVQHLDEAESAFERQHRSFGRRSVGRRRRTQP